MRVLKALRKSPMALYLYCWLTYRMSYLNNTTKIPWAALQAQFGANYADDAQGIRNFKKKFLQALKKVTLVYPEAKIVDGGQVLILKPSSTHIPRIQY